MATAQTTRLKLLKPDVDELPNPVTQISENMQKIDDGVALVGHAHTGAAGDGTQIQASGLADSAVTDPKIGNRTVDPALANPVSTGTLTQLLSWIVGRILAIIGGVNWWDQPDTTLKATKAHFDAAAGAHAGSAISNTPAGNIAAATVQGAINELDQEKAGLAQANVYTAAQTANQAAPAAGQKQPYWTFQQGGVDKFRYTLDSAGNLVLQNYTAGAWATTATFPLTGGVITGLNVEKVGGMTAQDLKNYAAAMAIALS